MRTTIDRIQAGRLFAAEDLLGLGMEARRVLRVILETVDDDEEISITEMNAKGGAFDHLGDEPDLYSDSDLIDRNEDFIR